MLRVTAPEPEPEEDDAEQSGRNRPLAKFRAKVAEQEDAADSDV
jgi:hypothetical protein